ncbi:MAG TPA: hypothetical protein VKB38_23885 [Terracidiphilus sp.]|nr:hypothetical protein [Terracidiphilus sp.]
MKGRRTTSLETVGRLLDGIEEAEKAIGANALQTLESLKRNASEAHIAAALHCALEAAKQQPDHGRANRPQLRAIEDDCRALRVHRMFEFTQEEPFGSRIDDCGNQFDRYSPGSEGHRLGHLNVEYLSPFATDLCSIVQS